MDVDEDDDFYDAPASTEEPKPAAEAPKAEEKPEPEDGDLEEGEEEDDMEEDGSDSVREDAEITTWKSR